MRLWVLTALLSGFCLQSSLAEEAEARDPVPIPAPALERVETEEEQVFEGAKNKPPFDLATAQQCEAELKRVGSRSPFRIRSLTSAAALSKDHYS